VIQPRDAKRVLEARARALAMREEDEDTAGALELATFTIGGHLLGVSMASVTRAAALRHLTEIPGGPPWLPGLTAVEGSLVSLLDLASFLELGRRGVGDVTGAIIVSEGGREIGLAAEQLLGIEDVPARAIAPLPVTGGAASPLDRVARLPGREVLLLDVPKLFDDPRLAGVSHG
jgi:chemotaxis signal transduction protein